MSIHRARGFTLIELLVVIAIIGILASVILASLNTARSKARDSERLSDIRQIQTALEAYYADHGAYPSSGSGGNWSGNCTGWNVGGTSGPTGYIPNLAPQYIPVLPIDPRQTASRCYLYRSDTVNYFLMAYQTVEGPLIPNLIRPSAPTEKDYTVYSPGAANW